MSEIGRETVLKKHPDAAHRVVDGEAVIVMPRDAKVLTLNPVGTLVWSLLEARTVAEIATLVTDEFDVNEARALEDTVAFLTDLQSRGMVIHPENDVR